jgi:hypothetical protein
LLLLTILFLGTQRSLPNATTLVLGYLAVCATIGIAGLILIGSTAEASGVASTIGRVISLSVGALLIGLGLRSALNTPDPEASLPRWMESMNCMTPAKAFGIGMALFPIQIKNFAIFIACIELIATASLGPSISIIARVLVLLIFAIPFLLLIGSYAAMPQRASNMFRPLRAWMEKHNRAVTVVLCFVFGAFFLVRGLLGL